MNNVCVFLEYTALLFIVIIIIIICSFMFVGER